MFSLTKDLGLYAQSRHRSSCRWASTWCKKHCYMGKFERLWPSTMGPFLARMEQEWKQGPAAHAHELPKTVKRVRLAKSGEVLGTIQDIDKVAEFCHVMAARGIEVWIPTRAWHNELEHRLNLDLIQHIENRLATIPGVHVQASIDVDMNAGLIRQIVNRGWSTMYVGSDTWHPLSNRGHHVVKCKKTFGGVKGACATCKTGCFSGVQTHVWLKKH